MIPADTTYAKYCSVSSSPNKGTLFIGRYEPTGPICSRVQLEFGTNTSHTGQHHLLVWPPQLELHG
jgi:hypothetical protein